MRLRLPLRLWLLGLWVALWESVAPGTLLGGLVVVTLLLLAFPQPTGDPPERVRPWQVVGLAGYFLRHLVVSTARVARDVLTPHSSRPKGVLALPVTDHSPGVITLLANAISLTPGTLTVEVQRDPDVLFVHVLDLDDVAAARRDLLELQRHVLQAFGTEQARAGLERRERRLDDGDRAQEEDR